MKTKTLEEKVFAIWSVGFDSFLVDPISCWDSHWAIDDFNRTEMSNEELKQCVRTEEVILNRLIEGLTSSNDYIRKYAQLLSEDKDDS